jgi:opacity protein-like surface antigen
VSNANTKSGRNRQRITILVALLVSIFSFSIVEAQDSELSFGPEYGLMLAVNREPTDFRLSGEYTQMMGVLASWQPDADVLAIDLAFGRSADANINYGHISYKNRGGILRERTNIYYGYLGARFMKEVGHFTLFTGLYLGMHYFDRNDVSLSGQHGPERPQDLSEDDADFVFAPVAGIEYKITDNLAINVSVRGSMGWRPRSSSHPLYGQEEYTDLVPQFQVPVTLQFYF